MNNKYCSNHILDCDYKKIDSIPVTTLYNKKKKKKKTDNNDIYKKKKRAYTTNTEIVDDIEDNHIELLARLIELKLNTKTAIFNCNLTCIVNIVTVIAFLVMLIVFR